MTTIVHSVLPRGWDWCARARRVETRRYGKRREARCEPRDQTVMQVEVTIVEPGPFRTDFLGASSLERTRNVISDYGETAGAARQWADSSHNAQLGDPAKAAAAMVRICEGG